MVQLARAGLGNRAIARELGCSHTYVAQVLRASEVRPLSKVDVHIDDDRWLVVTPHNEADLEALYELVTRAIADARASTAVSGGE